MVVSVPEVTVSVCPLELVSVTMVTGFPWEYPV